MPGPGGSSRRRTVFVTLVVIALLVALTWYRARMGRAQWGAADTAESGQETAVGSDASGT